MQRIVREGELESASRLVRAVQSVCLCARGQSCCDLMSAHVCKMLCKVPPKISTNSNQRGVTRDTQEATEVDYETALDSVGYGSFSRSVLGACCFAFFTSGVENCVMSYVLPAARCELRLSTYQAGLVNMAFMSGGVASAFFWGIVGDVFGRRNVLSVTLLLDAAVTLAQSTVPDYRLLLAARTINGFVVGGPATLVFTYLSDLVGVKRRQLYLTVVGLSFVLAWLLIPAMAWIIIPFKIPEYPTVLPLYSWRLFLALSSLPACLAGVWLLRLPESPRLLLDTNRSEEALRLLHAMHRRNHAKHVQFKIKKLLQDDDVIVAKSMNSDENRTKDLFLGVLRDLKTFVSKSYAIKSSLILFVFFANMSAGFGLNMWIPELLLRMQTRDCRNTTEVPDTSHHNATNIAWKELTKLYDGYAKPEIVGVNASSESQERCNDYIDQEVFTSGLIVGACCVVCNAACAVLCARGGARGVRFAAAACAGACALACACLAASACGCAASNKMAVASAAVLNAASLNGNVLLIRMLLNALPAKLSGLGVCWGAWWGRAGGVASNLAVGALLDYSCPAPFAAVAALLALSIGAIMFIQETGEDPQTQEPPAVDKAVGLDRYISTYM